MLAALLTPLGAFIGAAATITAVYFLGRREGQIDGNTLLLGGVITGSFISAIIMFLMSTLSGNLRGLSFWLMGELSTPLQKSIYWFLGIGFLAAAGAIYTTASDLNLLLAGEKEAMHLGVDVPRVRLVVIHRCFVPHRVGRLRERRHRLRRPDRAPRDASHLRLGPSHLAANRRAGGAIAVVFADTIRAHRCRP